MYETLGKKTNQIQQIADQCFLGAGKRRGKDWLAGAQGNLGGDENVIYVIVVIVSYMDV